MNDYHKWRALCKKIEPTVQFDGDKDICYAGGVGEWDGLEGTIYYENLSLAQIVRLIRANWTKVSIHAEPYLRAMSQMNKATDTYGSDSGVVLYFLNNAQHWRGDIAKAVRAELRSRCS